MNASHISQHGDHGGLLLLHLPVGVRPVDPGEVRLPGHLEQAVPGGGARLRYKVLHMKIEKTFLFEDLIRQRMDIILGSKVGGNLVTC